MKKILLYAVGCVVIALCVVCYFVFTQAQECKNERDKISGCVEKEYDENGNLESEFPYKNGERHGVAKEYYGNGNLMRETPFENGEQHGVVKAYYENGNLQAQVTYENGSVVSGVCGDGKKIPNIQGLGYWDIGKQIFEICKE
ncbi:toxin-antitoxin system YwqK family antitoxin [uncultured Helicobacter sp.]|uniref:toxin-antitoxin system YwqK family antitoxin n=1 Tax=uncultured Helicobacter sp. TaxID=175537 RepID=UPI00374F626C